MRGLSSRDSHDGGGTCQGENGEGGADCGESGAGDGDGDGDGDGGGGAVGIIIYI
jgi:hypothetical protein